MITAIFVWAIKAMIGAAVLSIGLAGLGLAAIVGLAALVIGIIAAIIKALIG